ncbi:hypothetical protein BDW02DRAFT_254698 [Decorospora gaudefroyi]|uniref:Uncharacterized protein n=1 Tax=Decorospora gaudefroyi TaxID=184978 RepID=A0A6A5KR72_9PLEO|nr:hypothetical protein BDW02DRAFT_254698 [Decorospora gaudefroyi]
MVLSILIAAITAPGLLGSQEAIRQSQSKEKREEHRARRCNLIATCVKSSNRSREINGRQIVLRNGKLWIDTGTEDGSPLGHPYAGYYLPYPDTKHEGLVTTITDVAPIMNWVYIDKDTHEARYGVRVDAQPNFTGPFDCTRQDRRLTFDGWEGWCAVEEAPGLWALYFDIGDDALASKVTPGTRVLEIELSRKEKRFQKEKQARQHDQTTKRAVDAKEDAPVDQPLAAEALVSKPGVVDQEGENTAQRPYRPLKIPKSIFDDPPPVVEPLTFRPFTPPPAYSPATQQDPREAVPTSASVETEEEISSVINTEQENGSNRTVGANEARSQMQTDNRSVPTMRAPDATRTPPSKTPPAPTQSTPPNEKRTTPKLNRSSGTRALAQAQIFEAMAAGQTKSPSDGVQRKMSKRGSRVNSVAGSTSSVYSNEDEPLNELDIKEPAPLALKTKAKAKAPAAMSDPSVQRPITPPRQRAPSAPVDPAVFGTRSAGKARAPPPQRLPSTSSRGPVQRSAAQSPAQRPTQRGRSSSDQSVASRNAAARPSPRQAPGRQSLARTMTTGKANQGMTSRIAERNTATARGRGSPVPARLRAATGVGRKTTSALFREIDELVSQEGGGGSGSGDGSKTK